LRDGPSKEANVIGSEFSTPDWPIKLSIDPASQIRALSSFPAKLMA